MYIRRLNYYISQTHSSAMSMNITAYDICHAKMDTYHNVYENQNAFHPKSFIDLILRKNFYQIYFVVHGQI